MPARAASIAHAQSLKYMNNTMPPTPPAKNTPPHENEGGEAAPEMEQRSRIPFFVGEVTPTKQPEGIVSVDERTSPTKYGGYAQRHETNVVSHTPTSHVSVYPQTGSSEREYNYTQMDMLKARLSAPESPTQKQAGHRHQKTQSIGAATIGIYSPSIYSPSPRRSLDSTRDSPSKMQQMAKDCGCPSQRHSSAESRCTVHVSYPDLLRDHQSLLSLEPHRLIKSLDLNGCEQARPVQPVHGRTQALQHDHATPSPRRGPSIFASNPNEYSPQPCHNTPSAFSHTSAVPSPLGPSDGGWRLQRKVFDPVAKGKCRLVEVDEGGSLPEVTRASNSTGLGIHEPTSSARESRTRDQAETDVFRASNSTGLGIHEPTSSARESRTRDQAETDIFRASNSTGLGIHEPTPPARESRTRDQAETDIFRNRPSFVASTSAGASPVEASFPRGDPSKSPSERADKCQRVPTEQAHEFYRRARQSRDEDTDAEQADDSQRVATKKALEFYRLARQSRDEDIDAERAKQLLMEENQRLKMMLREFLGL